MKQNPDALCGCGSKKRYRNCCKPKRDREKMFLFIGVVIGGVFLAKFLFADPAVPPAPPGKVWSAEHGHYHDAVPAGGQPPAGQNPGTQGNAAVPPGNAANAPLTGTPQPPGAVPPGKVWSSEHGHWHDVTSGAVNPAASTPAPATPGAAPVGAQNVPQPAGPVPPGKVWSSAHGHWHDAPKP